MSFKIFIRTSNWIQWDVQLNWMAILLHQTCLKRHLIWPISLLSRKSHDNSPQPLAHLQPPQRACLASASNYKLIPLTLWASAFAHFMSVYTERTYFENRKCHVFLSQTQCHLYTAAIPSISYYTRWLWCPLPFFVFFSHVLMLHPAAKKGITL